MSLSINSANSSGLSGLAAAERKQNEAIAKLVSGKRINSASDDSSGLSISTKLDSQIRGLTSASMNGQNAISMLQTADGGLSQTTSQLQRIRDLTVQAAGTSDTGALSAISQEITQSVAEIDRISQSTSWGSKSLLDGSLAGGTTFHIGASGSAADQFSVAVPASGSSNFGLNGLAAAVAGGGASNALASIDTALQSVTSTRTNIGAAENALGNAVSSLGNQTLNVANANSRIMDADYAQEVVNNSLAGIQRQASTAMLAQQNGLARNVLSLLG